MCVYVNVKMCYPKFFLCAVCETLESVPVCLLTMHICACMCMNIHVHFSSCQCNVLIFPHLPSQTCVWEHTMLTRALINEDSRDDGRYIRRWDGVLGPEAEKLLEHYAILNGLNQLQRACVYVRFFYAFLLLVHVLTHTHTHTHTGVSTSSSSTIGCMQ